MSSRPTDLGDGSDPALSAREVQVLQLLAMGRSNREIAGLLGLSVGAIDTYKSRALRKLGLRTRVDIVRYAEQQGWFADGSTPRGG